MCNEKLKPILLKAVPENIYKYLIKEQAKMKIDRRRQFSLESTVYKLLNDLIKDKENG